MTRLELANELGILMRKVDSLRDETGDDHISFQCTDAVYEEMEHSVDCLRATGGTS
jgi:hypothetical protein